MRLFLIDGVMPDKEMRMVKLFKAMFKHWHYWHPVKRPFEVAIGCRCGIRMMCYQDLAGAKAISKLSNRKEWLKFKQFLKH